MFGLTEYAVLAVVFEGVAVGGSYALVASSLNMQFGGLDFPNASLGAFFILGAYIAFYLNTYIHSVPLSILATLGLFAVIFVMMEVLISTRIYKRENPALTYLLISIGFLTFILGIYDTIIPSTPETIHTPLLNVSVHLGSLTVNMAQVTSIVIEYAVILFLLYFVRYTKHGRALRAMVFDRETASLMGINIVSLGRVIFIGSSLLSVAAGIVYAISNSFDPTVANFVGVLVFAVVIVGGRKSILGSMFIAIVYGFVQSLVSYLLSPLLPLFFFYGILFAIFVLRPEGLFRR